MDQDNLAILLRQDDNTLAFWWCRLNSNGFPEDLPNNSEPQRREAMRWIFDRLGHRRVLQCWNCTYTQEEYRMTPEEFDDFWRGRFEHDAEALVRDEQRLDRLAERMSES